MLAYDAEPVSRNCPVPKDLQFRGRYTIRQVNLRALNSAQSAADRMLRHRAASPLGPRSLPRQVLGPLDHSAS